MVRIPTGLAYMLVQPHVHVGEPQPAVLAPPWHHRPVALLGPGRVLKVQRLEVVLEGVAPAENPGLVAVRSLEPERLGLVGVNLHVELDQRRVERTLEGALDLVQRTQLVALVQVRQVVMVVTALWGRKRRRRRRRSSVRAVRRRVDLDDLILPVALLVPDEVVVTREPALAHGALVGAVLWRQMRRLMCRKVGVEVVADWALFFLTWFVDGARG